MLYIVIDRFFKKNIGASLNKNTFAATEWRQYPEYPGGTILDTTVHDMAALRHMQGGIPPPRPPTPSLFIVEKRIKNLYNYITG